MGYKFRDERPLDLSIVFKIIFAVIAILLLSRLVFLQAVQTQQYAQQAKANKLRLIKLDAPRGVIYDRNWAILAENMQGFKVSVIPLKLRKNKEAVVVITDKLGLDATSVSEKIVKAGWNSPHPILLKRNPSPEDLSYFAENPIDGLELSQTVVRLYPNKETGAHILGYTGELTANELKLSKYSDYTLGDVVGKEGIETIFENDLKGEVGLKNISPTGEEEEEAAISPKPGNNIKLTIDSDLQAIAQDAVRGLKATVVVMDPNTGEILAMVSNPTFDPNIFQRTIAQSEWDNLQKLDHPFLNRALSAYPSGSTFKPFVSVAALEEKKVSPTEIFLSTGSMRIGNRIFNDWKKGGFGYVRLEQALAYSIDTVYYELGLRLGADNIHKYADMFGFGKRTGVNLPGESDGNNPSSKWKQEVYHQDWMPGDSANFAIGQGFFTATPLQLAVAASALINGGYVVRPTLVEEIITPQNKVIYKHKPEYVNRITASAENIDIVKQGMLACVEYGTGQAVKVPGLKIAAKTGSAEARAWAKTHSWFLTFAPYDKPSMVIVVFAEEAGHGGEVGAPIARKIYQYAFNKTIIYQPTTTSAASSSTGSPVSASGSTIVETD